MINNWINSIVFILAPEEEEKISLVSKATDEIFDFIFSYLLVKTEIDEIISQGIKKPSCSDLLPDTNNSMVELEKPSTLFKVAQGPEGRYFFSVKTSPPLKFPSRSASLVSLNTGNNWNQE